MKARTTLFTGAAAAVAVTVAVAALAAQRGEGAARAGAGATPQAGPAAPARAGGVPRLANGKPDLSGLWANPYTPNMAARNIAVDPKTKQPLTFARQGDKLPDAVDTARTFDLPYTEWGLKQWKQYDPVGKGDYAGNCLPFGMPRSINSPHGVQIVHHPDALAFLFEQNTWHHWVPTSAAFKWPADLPETWTGVSTGRWDGDTLIVETRGFNGYTKLDTAGHPHSKEMVLTNTFTRVDAATMQHTMTVHDPKAYTRDWMNVRTWRIKPAPDVLMEYSCEENNLHNILEGTIKIWQAPDDIE